MVFAEQTTGLGINVSKGKTQTVLHTHGLSDLRTSVGRAEHKYQRSFYCITQNRPNFSVEAQEYYGSKILHHTF